MTRVHGYLRLLLGLLFAGVNLACASFQVGVDVNAGRQAFLIGNYEPALAYFQSAAGRDPNYIYGTALRQNIWSYVGRAEYANNRLPQAKQSLERALAASPDEPITRLYLGMTMARIGDRQSSLKEIEAGLKGIYDWLEYVTQTFRFTFGQYWDPNGTIRAAARRNLESLATREFDWPKLLADCEWLANQMESESDRARSDEARQWNRESGDGRGRPKPGRLNCLRESPGCSPIGRGFVREAARPRQFLRLNPNGGKHRAAACLIAHRSRLMSTLLPLRTASKTTASPVRRCRGRQQPCRRR